MFYFLGCQKLSQSNVLFTIVTGNKNLKKTGKGIYCFVPHRRKKREVALTFLLQTDVYNFLQTMGYTQKKLQLLQGYLPPNRTNQIDDRV